MEDFRGLTGLVQREDTGYVALCPELDIASQGETVEEARRNLKPSRPGWQCPVPDTRRRSQCLHAEPVP